MKAKFLLFLIALLFILVIVSNAQIQNTSVLPVQPVKYWSISAAQSSSTTTLNVSYPAVVRVGDLITCHCVYKYPGATISAAGFTLVDSEQGGAGASGLDSGEIITAVFTKTSTGAESGTFSVTFTGGNAITCRTYLITKDNRYYFNVLNAGGSDNTAGTAWSVTSNENLVLKRGDIIAAFSGHNAQSYSWGVGTFTQTGTTFATNTQPNQAGTSAGDDLRMSLQLSSVSSTSSPNTPVTFDATMSGTAGNAPAGATVFLVFRQSLSLSYFEWLPEQVTQPSDYATLAEGTKFWINPNNVGLRNSMQYTGLGYSIESYMGYDMFKAHIDPRDPDPGPGLFNFRNEVEKWPNKPEYPLLTRELYGFIYATDATIDLDRPAGNGEIIICQNHPGTAPGGPYPANHPIYYYGLAYDGQGSGVVQNQLRIVNKVMDAISPGSGQTVTTKIFEANKLYAIVTDIVYDTLNGSCKIWFADVTTDPGAAYELILDASGIPTVWQYDAQGGSNAGVGGNWKALVYAQGLRTEVQVESYEALCGGVPGCYTFNLYARVFKNLVINPAETAYTIPSSTLVNSIMDVRTAL